MNSYAIVFLFPKKTAGPNQIFAFWLLTFDSTSDKCNKLPEIKNLGTTVQLPVSYNTPVTVQCDHGFSLMGGDVITCIKGDNYTSIHHELPFCKESESFDQLEWISKFRILS